MYRLFQKIKGIESQPKVDSEYLLKKVLNAYNSKEQIYIENISEFEYLWNHYPPILDLKKSFTYPFDDRTKQISKIKYSKEIKDICAEILLNHFDDSEEKIDIEIEIILKEYFSHNINFLKEVRKQKRIKSKEDVIEKWIQYGLYYSKDPEFYKYCMLNTKKKSGYLDKKYYISKMSIVNKSLSPELNKIIAKSLTKQRAKDICWIIKNLVDKRLGAKDSKHFYNLKHKYKKNYDSKNIIYDVESKLCVLLTLKRGSEVADIVTSFLPEEYCVFIFPFCTNNISINNLKRRSIIQ